METNAYYEGYLESAQDTLGNMMDYAVNVCNMGAEEIFVMFLTAGAAQQFEKGNPRYVAGVSGAELAKEVVLCVTKNELTEPAVFFMDKSPEYWCGYILAYYQWRTGRSFQKIHQVISIRDILNLYPTHHEADEERAVETLNQMYEKRHDKTYLQQIRENMGLSKCELAKQTELKEEQVSELEHDFSKIKEVSTVTLFRLAQVLGATMEDLMEI